MSKLSDFCQKAITKFEENPIDALFCYIQCDKELMKNYLELLAEEKLGNINRTIARTLAVQRRTNSCGIRNEEPNSSLIQSYSILEEKER